MEVVLRTVTPDGIEAVLPALVYAKILEEHDRVADPPFIDQMIRSPTTRRADPKPWREQFIWNEQGRYARAVVDYREIPAIIVTVFDIEPPR